MDSAIFGGDELRDVSARLGVEYDALEMECDDIGHAERSPEPMCRLVWGKQCAELSTRASRIVVRGRPLLQRVTIPVTMPYGCLGAWGSLLGNCPDGSNACER
jgi:hypothetical protein